MCEIKLICNIIFIFASITSVLSSSANDTTIASTTPVNYDDPTLSNNTDAYDYNSELINKLRIVPLTDALNDFGMQFIRQLNNGTNKNIDSNIAFSPLSIGQMFSMAISGAQNQTLTELMRAFGFTDQLQTSQNVNNAFRLLLDDYDQDKLEQSNRSIRLSLPSIAIYSSDFNIRKSFRKSLKQNYRADASKQNFSSPEAVNVINEFTKKSTNGLITKIVEKFNPDTKLALVNAFYFKGEWIKPFDKEHVKTGVFNNADQTTKQTQMMKKQDRIGYFEDNDIQMATLPYLGNVSMIILLPQKNKSIDDLIKNLNTSLIEYYRYQTQKETVDLTLPKLKIENTIELKKPLMKMGITKLFGMEAELSGVTSSKNVYVSDATHKAYLDINEQGTEATAVTIIRVETKSRPRNVRKMIIDRPFLFIIQDDTMNNVILFMGAIKKL